MDLIRGCPRFAIGRPAHYILRIYPRTVERTCSKVPYQGTAVKIGRNEPCWCGSGRKYKHCHLLTDEGSGPNHRLLQERQPLPLGTVAKGHVVPEPPVPEAIPRPPYAIPGTNRPFKRASSVKSAEELSRMRRACAAAREVLEAVLAAVAPGVTTEALNRIAYRETIARGAYPSTLHYGGFTKSMCTSVNEVICHGIPDDRPLEDGDIVNCDITVYLDGMHGDCSETVFVGTPSPERRRLVEVTYECMMLGIEAVKPGLPLNVIGKAIENHAVKHGYSVVRDFLGHGIGRDFHMDPNVQHYFDPRDKAPILLGQTFTIEPMINAGKSGSKIWPDGWTAVTADGSPSAQFEHTILVTQAGAEILTGAPLGPYFKRAKANILG